MAFVGAYADNPQVEVEIKLGYLMNQSDFGKAKVSGVGITGQRILPSTPQRTQFHSRILEPGFRRIIAKLNAATRPDPRNPFQAIYGVARYEGILQADVDFPVTQSRRGKCRLSYNVIQGGQPVAIEKRKRSDMCVFFGAGIDMRIAASEETDLAFPADAKPEDATLVRKKCRSSYTFSKCNFRVDITEVLQYKAPNPRFVAAIMSNRPRTTALRQGTKVAVFSHARKEWVDGVVVGTQGSKIEIDRGRACGGRKLYSLRSPLIEQSGFRQRPAISYEVEIELLPGALTNAQTRQRVVQQWLDCAMKLRNVAQMSQQARSQHPHRPHPRTGQRKRTAPANAPSNSGPPQKRNRPGSAALGDKKRAGGAGNS